MDIYIDLPNIVSFLKSKNDKDYYNCLRLLQYNLEIKFCFSKSEIYDLMRQFSFFTDGRGSKETTDKYDYPKQDVIENTDSFSVYMLDCEDKSMYDRNDIIIGNSNNTIDTIKRLFLDDQYNLTRKITFQNFKWNFIKNYKLPISDIVICDRYLIQNESKLEQNIYELFKNINNKYVDIVMFCDKQGSDSYINNIINNIKKIFDYKANVTFVFYGKIKHPHDRCIILNYSVIESGDSFCNIISNNNTNTQGFGITFMSLAQYDIYNSLDYIKEILNTIVSSNNAEIIGDKKSQIIRF